MPLAATPAIAKPMLWHLQHSPCREPSLVPTFPSHNVQGTQKAVVCVAVYMSRCGRRMTVECLCANPVRKLCGVRCLSHAHFMPERNTCGWRRRPRIPRMLAGRFSRRVLTSPGLRLSCGRGRSIPPARSTRRCVHLQQARERGESPLTGSNWGAEEHHMYRCASRRIRIQLSMPAIMRLVLALLPVRACPAVTTLVHIEAAKMLPLTALAASLAGAVCSAGRGRRRDRVRRRRGGASCHHCAITLHHALAMAGSPHGASASACAAKLEYDVVQ
jgi:hypothetical protein